MNRRSENARMVGKLAVITVGMFAFGYALIPIYQRICEATGINILSLSERQVPGNGQAGPDARRGLNTQVDKSRTITVEFDANARGPWEFKPAQRSVQVHPGELTTVMYEFQNVQDRRMAAQAIPSYAPRQAAAHFTKIECFCFTEQVLQPHERVLMPVTFYVDPELTRDGDTDQVRQITLSYTFYQIDLPQKQASLPPAEKPAYN